MAIKEKTDQFLKDSECDLIERTYPDGLTSAQIIIIFQSRGLKLSEATFRKYVQLGLVPRCKRVGTKGKHKGSHGVYPCSTVRSISTIKKLMSENYTIEEIQQKFGNVKKNVEELEGAVDEVFKELEKKVALPHVEYIQKRQLEKEIALCRNKANELVRQINLIESKLNISEPRND